MIRINLLPVEKTKKRETGKRQLVLLAAVLGVEAVCITAFHLQEKWKIDQKTARNNDAKSAIAQLKMQVGDYEAIKAERDKLIQQRDAINRLQAGRSGPVFVLRELSEMLTKDKG